MEGTKRRRKRIPRVQHSFEWSRLEDQLMASAYENILPIVRHGPGIQRDQLGSSRWARKPSAAQGLAAGA